MTASQGEHLLAQNRNHGVTFNDAKDGSKPNIGLRMLGASLSRATEGKAPSEMSALKP
jgi:hypothetical protein